MSKSINTKKYIIKKTSPIFNMKGFAATSLSDICNATGLTKGSIYGNFKNKDEVALEVLKFNLQKMSDIFSVEIEKKNAYKEKLLVYPELASNFNEHIFLKGGCPLLNTAIEADDTNPILKKITSDALIAWKNKIIDLIECGKQNHEFEPNLDSETIAITILALIEGAIMIRKLTDNSDYIKMAMNSLIEYIKKL